MSIHLTNSQDVRLSIREALNELVSIREARGSHYVSLPLIYPDGSFVTVRVEPWEGGVRVTDAGFAFREIEDVGRSRSFRRVAGGYAESADVCVTGQSISVIVQFDQIERAICDVAATSWKVADKICSAAFDEDEEDLVADLSARLVKIFGEPAVGVSKTIIGRSTSEWPVSAVVSFHGKSTVFQAVSGHANSVYRTSTAFRDIAGIENAPGLVAFVKNKKELGPKLALLAPGKIVEEAQPDDYFQRAAA